MGRVSFWFNFYFVFLSQVNLCNLALPPPPQSISQRENSSFCWSVMRLFLHNVRVFVWGFRIRIHLILIRIRIQIQHFRLNTNPDADPVRIQGFDDQKFTKIYSWKKICFASKTTIYLSLGSIKDVQVTKEAFSSQKRTSSTWKHEIYIFFLLLWVIFALLDPDPDTGDSEYGSGSTNLTESGSNTDPDPKNPGFVCRREHAEQQCPHCPMVWFNNLCTELDGLSASKAQSGRHHHAHIKRRFHEIFCLLLYL